MTKNSPRKKSTLRKSSLPKQYSPIRTRSKRVLLAREPKPVVPKRKVHSPILSKTVLLRKLLFAMKTAKVNTSSKTYKPAPTRPGVGLEKIQYSSGKHASDYRKPFYEDLSQEDQDWFANQ